MNEVETVQPFLEQNRHIAMHKVLFDRVMPSLSGNAWKVLCYIIRKTKGYQKQEDAIAYSQICNGCGIKSRQTVRDALMELTGHRRDFVGKKGTHGKHVYVFEPDRPQYVIATPGAERQAPNRYQLNREVRVPRRRE